MKKHSLVEQSAATSPCVVVAIVVATTLAVAIGGNNNNRHGNTGVNSNTASSFVIGLGEGWRGAAYCQCFASLFIRLTVRLFI